MNRFPSSRPCLRAFFRRVLAAVSLAAFLPFPPGTAQGQDLPPGAKVIEVLFDKEPVERGLVFDRQNVKPVTVEFKGRKSEAWVADASLEPAMPWTRSFRFRVSDPIFQKGGRPAVDIEMTYHLSARATVTVSADTAQGAEQVKRTAGNTKEWRTVRFPVDNAYFGQREHSGASGMSVSGFDLRINGANSDLYLRRVRIIGYDPEKNVSWPRMLRIRELTTSRPGNVLAYPQGSGQALGIPVQNLARVERPLHYRACISGYDDKVRFSTSGEISVPASGTQNIALSFDTTDWPLGPYECALELFPGAEENKPVLTRTIRLGVISGATLEKAREGEFLYGLDPANSYNDPPQTPTGFAYYRLMGVDILRTLHNKGEPETAEAVARALRMLGAEDLRAMVFLDPPKDADPARRAAELARKEALLEEITRLHVGGGPGKLRYFELGNEPDLPFFYPGTITEYLDSFYGMYDAIKRGAAAAGAAEDATVVMNGGLSFAGPVGDRRSREFLELVDPAKLDAIAFHGHGPGIEAERTSYERVHAVAAEYGKADRPFIQTESGFAGHERRGLEEQASTVVEKMVYAQSKGFPLFIYFRLFHKGAKDFLYTMTTDFVEPHPAVLSYRNLVERLRHHRFVKTLDFDAEAGTDGVDAYVFAEEDDKGEPTGRKAFVAFCEKSAQYDLMLRLDDSAAAVKSARVYDLYGNSSPATMMAGNVASLTAGPLPVFLTWDSPGLASDVNAVQTLLTVDTSQPLLAGAVTPVLLTANNPKSAPVEAKLSVEARSRLPITVEAAPKTLALQPEQPLQTLLNLKVGLADQPLRLPLWWKVFADVDWAALTPRQLAAMPDQLPGKKGPVPGRFVGASGHRIDVAKLAGTPSEKRPAVLYAIIDSPRDMELPCAASADWWMAWHVNGQRVYDTLESGNQHGSLADHTFSLPLKKGRNVISVVLLSGLYGWNLEFGGPKERELAVSGGSDPDSLSITLDADGQILSRVAAPLHLQGPVPPLGPVASPDRLAGWMPLEPLALLEAEAVNNLWMKEPEQLRWYGGKEDLSGLVWLRDDGTNLHLFLSVTDDKFVQAPSPAKLGEGDSLRIVVADDAGKPLLDLATALIGEKSVATETAAGVTGSAFREKNGAGETVTNYHVTFPKSLTGGQPFRLSLAAADYDADYLRQTLRLGDVGQPGKGMRLIAEGISTTEAQ